MFAIKVLEHLFFCDYSRIFAQQIIKGFEGRVLEQFIQFYNVVFLESCGCCLREVSIQ